MEDLFSMNRECNAARRYIWVSPKALSLRISSNCPVLLSPVLAIHIFFKTIKVQAKLGRLREDRMIMFQLHRSPPSVRIREEAHSCLSLVNWSCSRPGIAYYSVGRIDFYFFFLNAGSKSESVTLTSRGYHTSVILSTTK